MINTRDAKKSLIIPRWLDFTKSLKTGEHDVVKRDTFTVNAITQRKLEQDYMDFKVNPAPHKAADLMGASLIVNDMQTAKELAHYVKKCKILKLPTLNLADRILYQKKESEINPPIEVGIANTKAFLSDYPKNALAWIHIGRLYTIKGHFEKARRAVLVALSLAPYDRYISRCAVRFFLHIREFDVAWHYINRTAKSVDDPWVKATEINVSFLANKRVKNIKKLVPKNLPIEQIFQYSELIESQGMSELNSGNETKAKKKFKLAWSNPSPNVVRHGEWLLRNKFPGLKDSTTLNFSKSTEAMSWRYYNELKTGESIRFIKEWELEEPYSSSPFLLGSSVACAIDDHALAIDFARRGLLANPSDFLLNNNLCYALSMAGNLDEAEQVVKKLPSNVDDLNSIFLNATKGYFEFKKGNQELGRTLYLQAVNKCRELKEDKLYRKALLCLAIAEAESRSPKDDFYKKALELSENSTDPDIILIRRQLKRKIVKVEIN